MQEQIWPKVHLLPNNNPGLIHEQDRVDYGVADLYYGVPPHVKSIKWSQSDEPDQTVVVQLVLEGSTCHCPTVV